jgi:membrane-associated protease RseP (regulator of RpoE activity)
LFIVVVVHEFGHGIIAKAHGLKIRNTGFGFMGPLPLAFVEPDEKQVVKKDSVVQQSIFAAGPFFNGLLVILMLALIFVVSTILVGMTAPQGFHFSEIQPGYSAEKYGILANHTYTTINGAEINTMTELTKVMSTVKPNETLTIGDSNGNTTLITSASPKDSSKGYLGVMGVTADYKLKSDNKFHRFLFNFLMMLSNPFASNVVEYTLFQWIATLSLGIGLANLLPLGPVDGGRMLHKAAIDINGKDKGVKIWSTISIITLVTMILLVFVPIIKHVVFKM